MQKKLNLTIITMLLVFGLIAAGCGGAPAEESEAAAEVPAAEQTQPDDESAMEESQEEFTIPQSTEDFMIGYDADEGTPEQKVADLKQACQELDIQCVQGGSISELAGQGMDAIITFANKWSVNGDWPEIHDAAQVKGIPLYVLDAETGEFGAYNLSVESDALSSGLEWMFSEMGGEGEMVYYNFGPSDYDDYLIQQELEKYPGIQASAMDASYEDTSVASEEKIAEIVASNPNIGAIWSNEMLPNVFWGLNDLLDNLQPGDNIPLILCENSQDKLQFWKDRLESVPDFKCFTTIKPGGNAYEAVYVAYYRLVGLELDPAALGGEAGNTLIYDYPKVTNDNLDEWLDKTGDLRVGDWGALQLPPMTPKEIHDNWFLD